ncbi:hypothetical protein Acy02nite_83090 [Actinoplanes cyaneus]|uniref:DUF4240 domain-containing protein n=1 Tax=Actinoplanes cyaneus TaxID=52696 RepID=A0A919IS42_9ACTN|nr:DUF4240 domain-containing protein [Actinoplanes cyaneus]MCW2143095.1 Protein of unknown function (DUF4240) [Actinoplanes cyaneus]GID70428.1 hypothetical protein Acy02nite_83090 [Actinoplanes cyaneus]
MDEHHCWEIIEAARGEAGPVWDNLDVRLESALVAQLVRLPPAQVARFGDYFRALRQRVHRDDLFMAAFLIHHGCGDDSLGDFSAGLIGLGRDWYERVLQDPDVLAGHPAVRGVAAGRVDIGVLLTERFRWAPQRALRELAGEENDGYYDTGEPVRLSDPPLTGARLPCRLDALAALFPRQQQYLRELYPHLTGVS